MKIASYLYQGSELIQSKLADGFDAEKASLLLCFGSKDLLLNEQLTTEFRNKFSQAQRVSCSTAGEIFGTAVYDGCLSVTAVQFENTEIHTRLVKHQNYASSFDAGVDLVKGLPQHNLKYVMLIADGSEVNGSELVRGIESTLLGSVPVTGGLAGDGTRFESTVVGLNDQVGKGYLIAIGFYGEAIRIGHGSLGGWEVFGRERTITRSVTNELFEIDGANALELYKQYLGKYADDLPGSALLFPLSVSLHENGESVVRTILQVHNDSQSMVFAGDVPQGAKVRFMKSNVDNIIEAASTAAQRAITPNNHNIPKWALLISCVGRKIVLGGRTEEEVEAVQDIYGNDVTLSGFYSYGEISPLHVGGPCQLQNQTMTITTFDEV